MLYKFFFIFALRFSGMLNVLGVINVDESLASAGFIRLRKTWYAIKTFPESPLIIRFKLLDSLAYNLL
jgi:hypothetical protein